MAVEWTITIEDRNEFGDICRKAVRIDKSALLEISVRGVKGGFCRAGC